MDGWKPGAWVAAPSASPGWASAAGRSVACSSRWTTKRLPPPWRRPGRAASATSTRRRTTASGTRSDCSAISSAGSRGARTRCPPKWAGSSSSRIRRDGPTRRSRYRPRTGESWTSPGTASVAVWRSRCREWVLDSVDVLYLHDAEPHFEAALGQGYPALAELRAEGVVGAIGAGMGDATLLARLVEETDVDVVMLAGRYTLLDQSGLDDLLPACQRRGVSVVAAAVFNSGVLAQARPAAGAMFEYRTAAGTGGGTSQSDCRRLCRTWRDLAASGDGVPAGPPRRGRHCRGHAVRPGGPRERRPVRRRGTRRVVAGPRSQGLLDDRVPV